MRITIDTQHDTYEDIRKVLSILTNIIEKKNSSWNGLSNNTASNNSTDTSNLMNMFDSGSGSGDGSKEVADTPPDFSKFLNLVEKKEEIRKEDAPRIEFF
ncbi:MAG TPA: hypothetical protein VJA23_05935 [Candidatus Nanoarchaeia archaeon]|nr:hypothetical protein [Candidatus Nanoarchaeia archaeon]